MKGLSNSRPATLLTGYRGLAGDLIPALVKAGHSLSVLVRRPDKIASLEKSFPGVYFHAGDVAVSSEVSTWIKETVKRFGAIGALINNAAITGPGGKLHEVDFAEFEEAIAVDLLAPIRLIQQVLPHFLAGGLGAVVNLSGGGATTPRPHFAAYAIAKCALVRMTETLAHEYPSFQFYAVAPGALKTPMIESVLKMDRAKIGKELDEAQRRNEEGGDDPQKAVDLIRWLVDERPVHLNGRLVSAVWDDYRHVPHHPPEVGWWTLRRVDEVCVKNLGRIDRSG